MNSLDLPNKPADTRVVVAMSGGVDSSVTAALLKEQGYDVVGITLQLYDQGQGAARKGACCAGQDIHDARRVAEQIGIPHYVLDFESRFSNDVIADFADSYARGETPIPCVRCNQTVKFRDLLGTARDLGAEALATGHYVRHKVGPDGAEMHRAADPSRDQSYFLFATTAEQLSYLRFPLGGLNKSETRRLAERYQLAVAAKPDSQDICFVPDGKYTRIVERLRPEAFLDGDIRHVDGRLIGRHQGIARFTVGQRRGLGIGGGEVLYVVRLDAKTHTVYVGPQAALLRNRLSVRDVNWLGGPMPTETGPAGTAHSVQVKMRSAQEAVAARLTLNGGRAEVHLETPHGGIAAGQACVFYDGERVLGGGWIERDTA